MRRITGNRSNPLTFTVRQAGCHQLIPRKKNPNPLQPPPVPWGSLPPLPPKTRNPPLIHNLRCNCTILAGYSEWISRYPAIRARSDIFRKTPPKKSRNRPVAGTRNRRIGARYGPGWVVLPGRGDTTPTGSKSEVWPGLWRGVWARGRAGCHGMVSGG